MMDTPLETLPGSAELQVHEVVHLATVASTMDEAHLLAQQGASAGTLIIADEQTAGRGRGGNAWESIAGTGIWCTLIERPADPAAVDVLSIRLGLAIARALDGLAAAPIRLKWPNDVFVGGGKLAGILVEARWREGGIDWVAIGIGLNLQTPKFNAGAAALRPGITRSDGLRLMIPAIREAARMRGILSLQEQTDWLERDLSLDRTITSPIAGVVRGIEPNGALRVEDELGVMHELRTGSLVFA
ncbi:MAG: biotin--[acetyl-CoA-carboxylase] ligase [Phycisphaerae bacterium]|nr:biotin--[acetyl-CoA-carboxylase] ligase [Gemmatimonadaceae bacterium]